MCNGHKSLDCSTINIGSSGTEQAQLACMLVREAESQIRGFVVLEEGRCQTGIYGENKRPYNDHNTVGDHMLTIEVCSQEGRWLLSGTQRHLRRPKSARNYEESH